MFPSAGQEQARVLNRPFITVHLLLGMESHSLSSRDGSEGGNLRLNSTVFYPGWVLTGKVTDQDEFALQAVADNNRAALMIQAATIKVQVN
mgnify:CR=1 FL=1